MRIAVLHDHLDFIGGGERVALALAGGLDADLYVTDLDPTLPARAGIPEVRAFEIAKVPRRPPSRQDRQMRAFEGASISPFAGIPATSTALKAKVLMVSYARPPSGQTLPMCEGDW